MKLLFPTAANSLNSCMLSERVQDLTIERGFQNYRHGVGILFDEMCVVSGQALPDFCLITQSHVIA
jgi:hypothetical protein